VPDLLWPSFTPRAPERVQDHDGDMFAAIRQKDMLLRHPYDTFDMVIRFLKQAAADPNVVAIKQTLYRTSKNSPVVEALCEAAEDEKSVTTLVELKARFDEAAKYSPISAARTGGCACGPWVHGFEDPRQDLDRGAAGRQPIGDLYPFIGTGNYHPITARIYTNLSFFACDAVLGRDATKVFNFLSGYAQPDAWGNLSISPKNLQADLISMIAA